MPDLKLYHFPEACSRVALTALEEAGADYEDELIDLPEGEQYGEYKSINPRAKVPALLIAGELLTENAAILHWLNDAYPDARLLPKTADPLTASRQLADLVWVSSTWHPIVRAVRMPMRWTTGDQEPVKTRGLEMLYELLKGLNERLAYQPYFYGENWSILDVYLYWAYTTAGGGGADLEPYANIDRHRDVIERRPSFVAAIARENVAKQR